MRNNVVIYDGFDGTETNKSDNAYHVFYHPADLDLDETVILDG